MFSTIEKLSEENNGVIRTSDVVKAGISKPSLAKFVADYGYEKVAMGIYLSPDVWEDRLFLLQLRCTNIIYSHDTALFLLDMTDVEPFSYTVTVKSGYNASHLRADDVKVFSIKKELFDMGVINIKTPYGNEVKVYNAERTICDLIRSRSQLDIRFLQDAIKNYVNSKDKNLHLLIEYSEKLRVSKILKKYLEVLL